MAKATAAKRIRALEEKVLGMGFLLAKLQIQFGNAMGHGMTEQVQQAISDYRNTAKAIAAREAAKAQAEQGAKA